MVGPTFFNTEYCLWQKCLAEFFALLLFVFFSCGAVSSGNQSGHDGNSVDVVQYALCFGLMIILLVYTFMLVSGGHINPAVTVMFFVGGYLKLGEAVAYIIAQFAGAFAGGALLYAILGDRRTVRSDGCPIGALRDQFDGACRQADYFQEQGSSAYLDVGTSTVGYLSGIGLAPFLTSGITSFKLDLR
jgi:hypothetical protein